MYSAIMYTHPKDKGVLDIKGIALARGDSSPLTKKIQLETINLIMKNPLTAWEAVRLLITEAIQTIRDQDKSCLIKSRRLGENYKYPDRQVQHCVVVKMKERGQDPPKIGERVQYLIGCGEGNICTRADYPDNITEIDYQYYIESQILKPMKNILHILCKDWKNTILN